MDWLGWLLLGLAGGAVGIVALGVIAFYTSNWTGR